VLDGDADSVTARGGKVGGNVVHSGPLHISKMHKHRNFKNCVHIGNWGPNQKYATVGHSEFGRCHVTYFEIVGPPPISGMAGVRDLKISAQIDCWGP